jgi:hypothetical protein
MLLLAPFRLLRLATLSTRVVAHTFFRHRFGSVRAALFLIAIAAVIGFFVRNRRTTQKT